MDCTRCNGTRYFQAFGHIEGGRCFRCGGTGVEPQKTRRTRSLASTVRVGGATFPISKEIKAMGGQWDGNSWKVPAERVTEVRALVNLLPVTALLTIDGVKVVREEPTNWGAPVVSEADIRWNAEGAYDDGEGNDSEGNPDEHACPDCSGHCARVGGRFTCPDDLSARDFESRAYGPRD